MLKEKMAKKAARQEQMRLEREAKRNVRTLGLACIFYAKEQNTRIYCTSLFSGPSTAALTNVVCVHQKREFSLC